MEGLHGAWDLGALPELAAMHALDRDALLVGRSAAERGIRECTERQRVACSAHGAHRTAHGAHTQRRRPNCGWAPLSRRWPALAAPRGAFAPSRFAAKDSTAAQS
jgi:hypothetical protein